MVTAYLFSTVRGDQIRRSHLAQLLDMTLFFPRILRLAINIMVFITLSQHQNHDDERGGFAPFWMVVFGGRTYRLEVGPTENHGVHS